MSDLQNLENTFGEIGIRFVTKIGNKKISIHVVDITLILESKQYKVLTLNDDGNSSAACRFYFELDGKYICSITE